MTISKGTVMELNRIQYMVARFVLQLPKSAVMVPGYINAGMKPMRAGTDSAKDLSVCMEDDAFY